MAQLRAGRTETSLPNPFYIENLVSQRFLAYATQAEAEGKHHAAALFREIAERRSNHAETDSGFLGPIADTDNTISGRDTANNMRVEPHECSDCYPEMARGARRDELSAVAAWFETLTKASRSQANCFRRVLETLM